MTSQRRDHYAVLGVARSATPAEITHAYRLLLRRHHPDTRDHQDATVPRAADAELQRVIAAYEVLRDTQSRARYDQQIRPHTSSPPRWHPDPNPMARPPIVAGPVRWHRASGAENHA